MDGFVEGLGLLPGRQREFRCHNHKQDSDSDYESDSMQCVLLFVAHAPKR
jgi:hypothetical protein